MTWDVDSSDRATTARVYRYAYGDITRSGTSTYMYPGFVERPGVRYLGQSVLFVPPHLLHEIDAFLASVGVEHEAFAATIG